MARMGRLGFLAIAVVFHVIYIYTIFDVYFVSPIVSGMRAYKVPGEAPAKRLVLYVGDGLRADKAFQYFPDPSSADPNDTSARLPRPMAPFLRSKVLTEGTFGVSHTRVPTESRPGHVALIAGLYEDVSAVMTGWKMNPVNFDSVFNRSRHTWSWGSPDILPMFSTGAVPGRVEDQTYGHEFEDFSKDATELDYWVFDGVKKLFKDAATDAELDKRLREDKNVFFLHLLGLDTTGHSYRPYSQEYLRNIQVVDQGVKEITEMIEEFYGDGETAFVFTADHGMSDWGSHGDGHPDNTRTPLITWGSGVAKPVTSAGKAPGHEDGFSSDWNLDQVKRHDVAQADVAALMAYLAGLEYPVNSVGELPLSFLDADDKRKAQALLTNARSILEMYHVKELEKMGSELRYKPYAGFANEDETVEKRLQSIEALIANEQYARAIKASDELIKLGLQGLRYLQTYDWLFLRLLVTAGYLGWIAFAFTTAVDAHVFDGKVATSRTNSSVIVFTSALVGLYALLFVQSSSIRYYVYAFFPVVFWEEVFARRQALVQGKNKLFAKMSQGDIVKLGANLVLFVGLLEVMVQSYYQREVYTYAYVALAFWPLIYGKDFMIDNRLLCVTWALSCFSMSMFTVLPALKVESSALITTGGALILLLGVLYIFFEKSLLASANSNNDSRLASDTPNTLSRSLLGIQVGLIALAMLVTRSSVASLQAKQGLPLGTQMLGWLVLITSLIVPFLHALQPRDDYLHRLAVIFLALGPTFIILTISYEGLFFFAIAITLVSWVRLEHRIHLLTLRQTNNTVNGKAQPADLKPELNPLTLSSSTQPPAYRALTLSDTRTSLLFLYLLQSAFFSTGNIASISSFSLDAVYRLIPIFDPFSQGALLAFKLLAPFILVSANLGILTKRLRLRGGSLFAVVMGLGDFLTLRFFWAVRDEGSWLEIGESISVFVVASCLCVFIAGLEGLSEVLVRGVRFSNEDGSEVAPPKPVNGKVKEGNGSVKGGVKRNGMGK